MIWGWADEDEIVIMRYGNRDLPIRYAAQPKLKGTVT